MRRPAFSNLKLDCCASDLVTTVDPAWYLLLSLAIEEELGGIDVPLVRVVGSAVEISYSIMEVRSG